MPDDTHPDVDVYDHAELDGTSFFGKPVLDLDEDELRSLVVHLMNENERLEGKKMTPEQLAADRLTDHD